MLLIRDAETLRRWVEAWRVAGRLIGFVPTMGALHEGHLALVRRAKAECERVIVSIFVNPLQFGPGEDFERYPRPFDRDRRLCEKEGVDLLYHGRVEDLYPPDFQTKVSVGELTKVLCGPFRPGHFDGVCTVVTKLLLRTMPHIAYFGRKDYQQAVVIRRMVRDLDIPCEIRIVDTVRDSDGLALSSRNAYLSAEDRKAALCLWRGLSEALTLFRAGERRVGELRRACCAIIKAEPRAKLQYADIVDAETLRVLSDGETIKSPAVFAVAAFVGPARLIDNVLLQ